MSVLQLRRSMVVKDASARDHDGEDDAAEIVEIEKPFPLRTIEPVEVEAVAVEIEDSDEDSDDEADAGPSFMAIASGWARGLLIAGVLAAYPVMVVLASNVGDRNLPSLDRAGWTAPWAGAAAGVLAPHFDQLGWAPDAQPWAPMARLTAKPAYQQTLAESTGEFVALMQTRAAIEGRQDADLEAAARLLSAASTADQLRAGRDALLSHDRRLRRTSGEARPDPATLSAQLGLIETWAGRSQTEIAATAATLGGSPIDEDATIAVYRAKGRATAAYAFIDAMNWSDAPGAVASRNAALDAWRAAARFHPLVVLNASPDGSVFGNHPASMGYLVTQAQKATADYRALLESSYVASAPVPAEPVAADPS